MLLNYNPKQLFISALVILAYLSRKLVSGSRVLELTERFIDLRSEGQWLVMFYAPWCAHCKRLEPVWGHVAQALHRTNIRVGKLDCTRFPNAANTLKVSAFPTVVFFKDNTEYVFNGDRTKEELVNFALRLSGPPVQKITRAESIDHLTLNHDVFFLYVGPNNGSFWETYIDIAERHQPLSSFYCAEHYLVKDFIPKVEPPNVAVFKERLIYVFEENSDNSNLNKSLSRWISQERFLTFPKITRGNLHQFLNIEKYLVLAVLEENKLNELPLDMIEFREMVENVVRKHRDKYHKDFQFGWIGSPDLANSIAMTVLPLPHLLVVNATTQQHHLPEEEPAQLTPQSLLEFLDRVHNQSAPVLGGNSFWIRIYRMYFEGKTTLSDMWQGNPVLTAVLFGLPLGFLSLICYSICCADILDADDDEEEEFLHEKRE